MVAPKPVPTRVRPTRTRTALLAAGLKLLANRTIDGISVDEIVEAAHVAKGSFFYHFEDKHVFADLIVAEIRMEVERAVAAVNQNVADPAARIVRGVARYVLFAMHNRDEASILIRTDRASLDPESYLNVGIYKDVELALASGRFSAPAATPVVLHFISVTLILMSRVVQSKAKLGTLHDLFCALLQISLLGLKMPSEDATALLRAAAEDLLASPQSARLPSPVPGAASSAPGA